MDLSGHGVGLKIIVLFELNHYDDQLLLDFLPEFELKKLHLDDLKVDEFQPELK